MRYSRFFYARICSCLDMYFYLTAQGIPAAPMLAAVEASINIVTYQHGVYQLLLASCSSQYTYCYFSALGIPATPMLAAVAASINIITYQHGVYQLLLCQHYSSGCSSSFKYCYLPAWGIPAAPMLAAVAVIEIIMIWPILGFIPKI